MGLQKKHARWVLRRRARLQAERIEQRFYEKFELPYDADELARRLTAEATGRLLKGWGSFFAGKQDPMCISMTQADWDDIVKFSKEQSDEREQEEAEACTSTREVEEPEEEVGQD